MSSKELQKKALSDVLAKAKTNNSKKNETKVNIKKQANDYVMNSIRNKDAVYRTWDRITPEETTRKRLATISRVAERNPEAAGRMYGEFQAQKQDKTSRFYDPYTQSTHSSVMKLKELGYDVDKIDDEWFRKNSGLKNYLKLNDYTNSVKKPGKKASREEKAAYEYYQLEKAEANTKKAEKEQEDLRKYLTDMATAKDRTMRDDEIIASINWKKYPTLAKMREYAKNGAPMALSRGVNGSGNDWAYGVLWAAMNNGGTGDSDADIANSYLQNGQTWSRNQYIKDLREKAAQKRTAANKKLAQDAQYMFGGQGDPGLAYRAVMMGADPDKTRENINQYVLDMERLNRPSVARTEAWRRATQEATYGPNGDESHMVYASKQMNDTPGAYEREAERVKNQILNSMNNTQHHASVEGTRDDNTWRPGDKTTAAGLASQKQQWQRKADQYGKDLQDMNQNAANYRSWNGETGGWDAVFDFIADRQENNENRILSGNYAQEYKDNAELKLEELTGTRQARRDDALSNMFGFNLAYSDANDSMEVLRNAAVWTMFDGQTDYDQLTKDMSPEEKKQFDELLDTAMNGMTNPYTLPGDLEIEQKEKELNYAQRQVDLIARKEEALAKAEELAKSATGSGEYREQNVQTRMTTEGEEYHYIPGGDDLDMSVYYANNPWQEEMQSLYGSNTDWSKIQPHWSDVRTEYFMNEEQVKVLNMLYGNGTPEEKAKAQAYMDALNMFCLNQLKAQYQEEYQREKAQGPLGIFEGIASIPVNVVAGAIGLGGSIAALFGNEAAQDPTSGWYELQRYVTNTRDERGDVWDDALVKAFGNNWRGVGKFFNGVTYSMADNLMAMATTAGLGDVFGFDMASKTAERMIQLVMSSEATSSTMLEQLKSGKDPTEAAIMSLGGGMVEALTEKYSIEALLKPDVKEMLGNKKAILKFLGKNTLAEGSEEGASDVLNLLLDEIVSSFAGHESEIRMQVRDMMEADPSMTKEQAEQQVAQQWWKQLGMDVAAGALSGLVMSGGRVGMNTIAEGQIGKGAKQGSTYRTNGGDASLIQSALELDEGTQSRLIAEKLQKKIDAGKQLSNREVGNLVQNIFNDTNENIGKAAATVIENRAYDLLDGKDTGGMDRREAAQLISKAVSGEELTKSERRELAKNKDMYALAQEFMAGRTETAVETMGDVVDAIRKDVQVTDTVKELMGTKNAKETNTENVSEEWMANEDEIASADRAAAEGRGQKTGKNDVILDGEYGRITGMKSVKDEDGNRKTYFTVETRNGTQKIDITDSSRIRGVDFGTAAIIREATINKGMYQASTNQEQNKEGSNNFEQYTDILLKAVQQGKAGNIGTFLANAQRIRMAAMTGQAMPVVNMDGIIAREIYTNTQAEHAANRMSEVSKGANAKGKGQGSATFQGVEYGSEKWNKTLAKKVKNKNVIREMNVTAAIAKENGIDVRFYTEEEAREMFGEKDAHGINGWENKSGIGINIESINGYDAKTKEGDGRHHIMVTFGHEVTHWLQRNSLKGYNQLEQFVTSEMIRTMSESWLNQRLETIMEQQGLDLENAMSELVADSCDQILADESVAQRLEETNKGLFNQIKTYVKDLVGKIRAAAQNMELSRSIEAFSLMSSANRLAKVWLGAYDEVISGKIAEATFEEALQNPVSEFRMSQVVEVRTDGLVAQHNLREDVLTKLLDMGGIPMPSIGVINESMSWTKFGEISLFFTRDVVERALDQGRTYRGDAWTPMLRGHNPQTLEQAMNILRSQPARSKATLHDLHLALRTLRVGSMEELRNKATRATEAKTEADAFESTEQLKQEEEKLWKEIETEAKKQDKWLDGYTIKKPFLLGIIQGTEDINLKGITNTTEKREEMRKAIAKECENTEYAEDFEDFSMDGFSDEMLDRIVKYTEDFDEMTGREMQEAKPDEVEMFEDLPAIVLPNNIDSQVIEKLHRNGVTDDKISYYEAGNEQDRIRVMNEIKATREGVRFSKVGMDPLTKRDVYISNYAENTHKSIKIQNLIDLIQNVWSKKPIRLKIYDNNSNGRYIQAEFDPDFDQTGSRKTDVGKLAFGNNKGTKAERRAVMNLTDDYQDILSNSKYYTFELERKNHPGVKRWFYFINDIYYAEQGSDEAIPYRMEIDVKEKEDGNFVYTIFGREDKNEQRKKLSVMGLAPVNTGVMSDESASASKKSIAQNAQDDNTRLSKAQLKEEYDQALESGDVEQQKEIIGEAAELAMPNSKVRENGKLLKMYHGTPATFTVFRRDMIGSTGRFEGSGFNFTPVRERAASYANSGNVLEGYLDIQNPLSSEKKTISVNQLAQLIRKADPTGDYIIADYARETRDYGSESFVRREAMTAARQLWNSSDNDVDIYSYISAADSDAESLIRVFSELNYDGLIHYNDNGTIKTAVAFNPEQFKLADPVTYKDNGEPVGLDERMNMKEPDMRFSRAIQDVQEAEADGIDLDIGNHTASRYSRASFMRSDYYKDPDEMAKMLARNVLGSESKENIRKAKKWIKDVGSIAAMIADNEDLLDYVASPGRSSFKSNPEYGGSIDSSTICAKRRLMTGTIDAIQAALPNYAMTAEDFLQVRRMMKAKHYEVSCGLCFVESSRKNIAKYANQFMKEWNSAHPDNQVNMVQINTVMGLEETRLKNKEVYDAYEKFMNKLAQRKPKLFEMRSEYDNDILRHFRNDNSVAEKNKRGGMRINSFSDFEIVHLIDMMQVIMDMANVGLAGQAYTKVREFAEALGPTGLKINMSMIAKGVDADGRIIFDEVEGMKWSDVEDLRDRYADNVGTICVIFNEEQLMAAMADDRIDFIIPFHRSQWKKSNYADIGLPENTKDFTYWQNERYATPVYGTKKDGTKKKLRATNYMPNEYWNPKLSGKENAEAYLKMCAENNKIPKFWKWLQPNGDGSFSLKEDGSTDGYWKLLGDFKMYNHITGEYAAQKAVRPEFDMEACERMLKEYKGGHQSFPKAQDIVDEFVKEKTKGRKGLATGKGGKVQLAGNEIDDITRLSRATPESMDVGAWMSQQTPGTLQTEDERTLLQAYKDLRIKISLSIKRQLDYKEQIRKLESSGDQLTAEERADLENLRFKLQAQQEKQANLEDELYQVTSSEGYAGMMYRNNIVLKDFILGKTQDQVRESVEQMVDQVRIMEKMIAEQAKKLEKLAASQEVKAAEKLVDRKALNYAVTSLKKETNTSMSKKELEARVTELAMRRAAGEDITEDARALAVDMTNRMRGYQLDVMERMRGVTITIGPDELAEMKGNGMTMESVRQALKGTGIKVRKGDYSTLDTDTQEGGDLRILLPELPTDIGDNSGDALTKFISWAQSMRDGDLAAKQEMVDVEDTTMSVMALVSTINVGEQTEAYQKQNAMAAKTRQAAAELKQAGQTMSEKTETAGRQAVGMASVLQRDVHVAIDYYNTIAKKAAQEEKQKVRKDLIEKLRSENTRKLIQQQEKYQEMMKRDRKARGIAEDNKIIRNRIIEDARMIKKRILEETDRENIPEVAKPLARKVLEMLVKNDYLDYRRILNYQSKESLEKTMRAIDSLNSRDGQFDPNKDLDWLIVGSGDTADTEMADRAYQDLLDIESGLLEYRTAEGQGLVSLMDRKAALEKINHAVSEIWHMLKARSIAEINGRQMMVWEVAQQAQDDMVNSRFKGEFTGKIGHARAKARSFIVSGNTTPEYFFKNLKNKTLSQLYDEYHRAENRNGLEVGRAQRRIAEIAEKYGFKSWDPKKRYTFRLEKGGEVNLTLGEIMSLYATWEREKLNQIEVNGPEESYHLKVGGFYTEQEEKHKIYGREIIRQKAHKLTENDMALITKAMTEEQISYVEDMVKYMTQDIGALGNEASMRMYGIKKYNEKWYFPFEIWDGVKSRKSDQGAAGNTENRIAHSSFSKRRVNNASNALVIRDFTETAVKHIAQMINYNTFAPAIEFMNRVMNQQLTDVDLITEGDMENGKKLTAVVPEGETKRNLRAVFVEKYGKEAMKYFDDFQADINGGVKRQENTPFDKLLSIFKKNAVAGSLSVAAQQPLSYIRAAMMINPKYLAGALNPEYYKGSLEEMEKYSGVAVIKRMGKFDINLGKTAQDFMMPDGMKTKYKAFSEKAGNIATGLPELMDRMTWTRMWTACKLEQKALNPEMDIKSDEFLEKVAERFNEVMRKTQVYDSMLVRSKNMRSTDWRMKSITSFMAEPTLTANVLADAVANAKEKGGKATLAKAGATFVLSAVLQALVKGLISAGRNPQDKKTWDENVLYRFSSNLINELNPFSLIPGYGDLMEVLMKGELSDDAMNVIGKIMEAVQNTGDIFNGKDTYRSVEDSIGQLAQLFTNIPMKNLMRDGRAMWNYFVSRPYAQRENSKAVLYYQLMDLLHNSQNLTGVINTKVLGSNGWETKNPAYYNRIYQADKAGNKTKVAELIEYLQKARGVSDSTLNKNVKDLIKADKDLNSEEKLKKQQEYGLKDGSEYIREEYKAGRMDRKTAEKLYKEAHPKMTDKQIKNTFDKIDEGKKK